MTERRPITVQLDPQMVLALDALATSQNSSRSDAIGELLDHAIQAQEVQRKRNTQKLNLTLRVGVATSEHVRGVARARGESQNAAAAFLLEEGIRAQLDQQSGAAVESLASQLRQAVKDQQHAHDAQVHRLAYLLTRSVLECLATRNTANALLSINGLDKGQILSVADAAWTSAVNTLKNPTPAMRDALAELVKRE
ncbi:hypothetical protein GCM10022631_25440 [Deinococcus rubellus]|uniref:hypothetical protein n=1 Tax=Deinococcus rubellus TaxID=1889240 RepID=UPI0031EC1FA1